MLKLDAQDKRIADIFGSKEPPEANDNTLAKYLEYLKPNLEWPCQLTGIEGFDWEEYYTWGPGSKKKYDKLRKKNPSYMDTYELIGLQKEPAEGYGLIADVKRLSDNKEFELPLADLKATDKKSRNYLLLDDFSVWFVNS